VKRRSKMLTRVIFWTLGVIFGFAINYLRGGPTDPVFYIAFWGGMMLAAAFVHFDPPAVERWER
jgi:hypothetical protein